MNDTEAIKKHLTCSICSGVLRSPKTLPCFHTFCESCLKRHIADTTTSDNTEYFHCVICGIKTYPVDKSRKREQWAECFNTNSHISSIFGCANPYDSKHNRIEKENVIHTKCTPCSFDDKSSPSYCFCINCKEYLCEKCYNDHTNFKLTCSHTAIRTYDYPKDISLLKEISELGVCRLHTDKKTEFKCMDHGCFICCICAITLHRACGSILHVDSIHDTTELECDDSLHEMDDLNKLIAQSLVQKLHAADTLETISSRIEKHTNTFTDQLKSVLYHLEHECMPKYKDSVKLEKRKVSLCISECVGLTEILQKYSSFASLVSKHGSKNQKMLLKQYLNVKKRNIISSLELQEGSNADDIGKLINDEMSLFWKMLQEIINRGLERLSTLKEISHLESKTADQSASVRNRSTNNESIPPRNASQVAVEDTDNQSLMKGANGQALTTKTEECSIDNRVTENDNNGFTLKDTSNNNLGNDPEKHCSETETAKSSSTKDSTNQCLLNRAAPPVVIDHTAKQNSIKPAVNVSTVKDTVSQNSVKLTTKEVSNTAKRYSGKNDDTGNAIEQKQPSSEVSFSLIHCPIQKCSEYDVAIPGKSFETCSHNGVMCLQNGDITFIDKTNRIIKLLSAEFQYKTHQVMQERPLDIALIGKDAVGVATSKAIVIYEILNSEIRRKNTFQTCSLDILKSLCTVGENLALLETAADMTNPESYIQIRSKQNRIIKEIDNFKDGAGSEISLDKPNLIRSYGDDTELVVCEPDHMVVLGKSGRVKFDIGTGFLRNIDNLIVDMHKNMYLCDTVSGIIHMISGDSTRVSRVLLSGIENPASITFSPATNTLIIGCNCDDKAHVYRFQRAADI